MAKKSRSKKPKPGQHPLLAPRMLASVGLVGVSALGIALMLTNFILSGSAISALAAFLTVSLYWRDFRSLKSLVRIETIVALLIIAIDVLVPIYVFIERPIETAQLTASKIEIFPMADGTSDYVNITMINTGKIAAIGPGHGSKWVTSATELTRTQQDEFADQLKQQVDDFRDGESSSSETAPQEGFYFSAIIPMTRDALHNFLLQGQYLYLFTITEYFDINSTWDKPRLTETCNYFLPSGALYRCNFHNEFRLHR